MAVTKWILTDDAKTLRADVPNSHVTFEITPAGQPNKKISRRGDVFVRPQVWPPTNEKYLLTSVHAFNTLEIFKALCVRAFKSWTIDVEMTTICDGRGNYIIDISDEAVR